MKKLVFLTLLLLVLACAAYAANDDILGRPFPDFTAVDTEGNTFTLSEALKDHEAALINIWATWCPPCGREFPYLNEAYGEYGDRVAFIALSCEEQDTLEDIAAYRAERGLALPMGSDEGQKLSDYTGLVSIPTTVVVDRFGNAVFLHSMMFSDVSEIKSVLDEFLGNEYGETKVLTGIPKDSQTKLFPLSAARALYVENENARRIDVQMNGKDSGMLIYVVNGDTARVRMEIAATDNLSDMIYYDAGNGKINYVTTLLDAARGAYVYEQPMNPDDYTAGVLVAYQDADDPEEIDMYLISGEEQIEQFLNLMRDEEHQVSWSYAQDAQAESAALSEYILHIADQNGGAVPGAYVNFCTDTECSTMKSDDQGVIRFAGAPDIYHLVLLKLPAGYSSDKEFEAYTQPTYGEWYLRVKKD